ncbi:hypothetical protein GCM10027037_13750 [Mucilaginibacter koreensis]
MSATIVKSSTWTDVFSTGKGTVYQCDRKGCWYVDFAGKLAKFNYNNLQKLKKSIYQIDIEERLLSSAKSPDLEIIFICACDDCYVLSLLQIIAFKELLQGTFAMLELNKLIHDSLYRCIA